MTSPFSSEKPSLQRRSSELAKKKAAEYALRFIYSGMKVGLGTGSTAFYFIEALGDKMQQENLDILCVPTSETTAAQARRRALPLATLEETGELDLTVDGTDEVDSHLRLIKGGGGALLYEKIVASASKTMVVIAESYKKVETLGAFPLPVEVVPFGWEVTCRHIATQAALAGCHGSIVRRSHAKDGFFMTDAGHAILDCWFRVIPHPEDLAHRLADIPGVVEHGLFLGLAQTAILANDHNLEIIEAS